MNQVINVSVRKMVELVCRSGSIDARYVSSTRAREGILIHSKIQKKRKNEALLQGHEYHSEYVLKHKFTYEGYEFKVDGRADGIIIKEDYVAIEEIKSTQNDVQMISVADTHWHWAQAKCYGYFYCVLEGLKEAHIQLTYCNIDHYEEKTFERHYTIEEFESFFYDIIKAYFVFAKLDIDRISERTVSAKNLAFPFGGYRAGQREMAVSVYTAILKNKRLFIKAPTGIGKTMSAIFPAVKALSEGLLEKIFYITARNTTKEAALNAHYLMEEKGLTMGSILITAKEKICFKEKTTCNPVQCSYANGHFDRVNEAIVAIIEHETIISKETVQSYAEKYHICPFEYQLDLTAFVDMIICDYNYVFDPAAKLKRFFGEDEKNDYVVLTDEAHNLVDRAREMYSAVLDKKELLEAKKALGKGEAAKLLLKLNRLLLSYKKEYGDENKTIILTKYPQEIQQILGEFVYEADQWLGREQGGDRQDTVLNFYFKALDILRVFEGYDPSYTTLIEIDPANVQMKFLCMDPSHQLSLVHENLQSIIFFSATLLPIHFYQDIFGGEPEDFKLLLDSPFDENNFCLLVNNNISTKYKDRDRTLEEIADMIYTAVSVEIGNYMVFFSSYTYLDKVYGIFNTKYPFINTVVQRQGGREGDDFLSHFQEENAHTLLGFAVLGGVYSEGIDLQGDKLIGVIIVGVGLPLISPERDMIRDYYMERAQLGYEYAYMYPGMNKVLQAAGRVIRKEDDVGMVLLIDSRFLNPSYQSIFPWEWRNYQLAPTKEKLKMILNDFFSQKREFRKNE